MNEVQWAEWCVIPPPSEVDNPRLKAARDRVDRLEDEYRVAKQEANRIKRNLNQAEDDLAKLEDQL